MKDNVSEHITKDKTKHITKDKTKHIAKNINKHMTEDKTKHIGLHHPSSLCHKTPSPKLPKWDERPHQLPPHQLPSLDFSQSLKGEKARSELGLQIHQAFIESGCFSLRNFGINPNIIKQAFKQAILFFNQPHKQKESISVKHSPHYRGWYQIGEEKLNIKHQAIGDIKEAIKIGNDLDPSHPYCQKGLPLCGPNLWPNPKHLPQFQTIMETTYQAFTQLGCELMSLIAKSWGKKNDHFTQDFKTPMATLSPLRYPPLKPTQQNHLKRGTNNINKKDAGNIDNPTYPISAPIHSDFGCLTFLAQYDEAGLEILDEKENIWHKVPCLKDELVITIGDMLAFWSEGQYKPTKHRVANRSGKTRHSLAFFFDPAPTTKMGQTTALDYLLEKMQESSPFY